MENPSDPNSKLIHLRFTRLVFGLRPSPAIFGDVISHHLEQYRSGNPKLVELIESSLYVNDLVCGAEDEDQAFELYTKSKLILCKAGMNLRKWNSNSKMLIERIQSVENSLHNNQAVSSSEVTVTEEETSFAKSTTCGQGHVESGSNLSLLGLF